MSQLPKLRNHGEQGFKALSLAYADIATAFCGSVKWQIPVPICSLQTMDEYDFHKARHKANHNAWGSSKHPMRCSCWRLPMTISKNRRCCYIRVAGDYLLESLRLETDINGRDETHRI